MSFGLYQESDLVLIKALTPLHVGAGRGIGVVDLPIQRDAFGFPCIPSSSLRQPIRSLITLYQQAGRYCISRDEINAIFGPEPEIRRPAEAFIGAFNVLDAKLLAIPVRSLIGLWTYATSQFCLMELKRYIELCDPNRFQKLIKAINAVLSDVRRLMAQPDAQRLVVTWEDVAKRISVSQQSYEAVFNEEFCVRIEIRDSVRQFAEQLRQIGAEELLEFGLCVFVSDELFREVAERSIIRATRVRLRYETKTVEVGPWTEELVPEYTLFASVFLYANTRAPRSNLTACDVRERIVNFLNQVGHRLIIGGLETIGKGIIELKFLRC